MNELSKIIPDAVKDYEVLETDWLIKRWIPIDQEKIVEWYYDLIQDYDDWRWEYGRHKYMWKFDPQEKIGEYFQEDTSWLMLTWGDNTQGPVPWLRTITKPEFNQQMPGDRLSPRECFKGYAFDIIENLPAMASDVQVAIHTPGTKLPQHQDSPERLRFHIPVITDPDARFIIDGKDVHLPADGWIYIVNTTYPHYVHNQSDITRIHIYGALDTEQLLAQDLSSCETII